MAPLPKRRHTNSRQGKRRSHHALLRVGLIPCPQCRQPKRPHVACPNCGTYRGRQIVRIKQKRAATP